MRPPVAKAELKGVPLSEDLTVNLTVMLVEGHRQALCMDLRGVEGRTVEEPMTESVILGPREGFVENLRTNTGLLRCRIKSPNLRFEAFLVGRVTQTRVVLAYLTGTANDRIVEEARRRISRIDVDAVLESGYIEEFIEDSPFSPGQEGTPFPAILEAFIMQIAIEIVREAGARLPRQLGEANQHRQGADHRPGVRLRRTDQPPHDHRHRSNGHRPLRRAVQRHGGGTP
ncbi:MAG: spore germination protein [Bacillota bacterium]|nr:spore germination protein [Bacillota bacterium]